MLAVERDVKPRNMNFAKVEKRGGAINREGAFITKNTVFRYFFHSYNMVSNLGVCLNS